MRPEGLRRGSADGVRLRRTTWRLGLVTGVLVFASVALTALAVAWAFSRATSSETDSLLTQSAARRTDPTLAVPGTYLAVRGPDGVRVTSGMPAGLPDRGALDRVAAGGPTEQVVIDVDSASGARYYVVRTLRRDGLVVQAVVDSTQSEEAQERLRSLLAVAVAVGAVLAAGVATVVARRAVRPLVAVIAQQRRFVADASHELRTPLTLLSTRAQLLARRQRRRAEPGEVGGGSRVGDDLDALVRDVEVLSQILDDLLLAADPEGDRVWETVAVADLARQVRDSALAQAASRGVVVAITVGGERDAEAGGEVDGEVDAAGVAEPDTRVVAVPVALRRAITALLDGAIDHATTRVDLQVRREGASVVVLVVDDGPGVPGADDAERQLVFARFHHARPAVDGAGPTRPHHGIGLALVAEVVETHGGTVRVAGREDGRPGAAFAIRLPAA